MDVRPAQATIEVAIEAASRADAARLGVVLDAMAAEDPLFSVQIDPESGQLIMAGVGEAHLDGKIERLRREGGIDFAVGAPQVAYRETLGRAATVDHAQTGGSGAFARVVIRFEPGAPGSGYRFESQADRRAVPDDHLPGVAMGLEAARERGLLAGFPVIDFTATLVDGACHDVDSSIRAFDIAARGAFGELRELADPLLVEPVMAVEVTAPADCIGAVKADLNSRRGMVQGVRSDGGVQVIAALVPLSNMFGYDSQLYSISQGRAHYAMRFDHYRPVPRAPGDDPTFRPAIGMRA